MNLFTYNARFARPKTVRVFVPRVSTTEADWLQTSGLLVRRSLPAVKHWLEQTLTEARQLAVDAVILPELSVPESCIEILQDWSNLSGGTVIGGSHYHEDSKSGKIISRCPIVINGEVILSEKIWPSPFEKSPILGQGLSPGSEVALIRNSPLGDFAVLICSDYLDPPLRSRVLQENLDFLFVVACQRKSELYHDRMSSDCEDARRGLFIIYSNLDFPEHGDGRSAVFALMDSHYRDQLRVADFTDGSPAHKVVELTTDPMLLVELDITNKRPELPRTLDSSPNVVVVPTQTRPTTRLASFLKKIAHDDDRYRRIEELFVAPQEYPLILEKLETQRLVFIIGDPGIGKTYTAVRLLLEYYDRGYQPVWFTGLEREERLEQRQRLEAGYEPHPRHVIYFEDPFGRTVFETRDSIAQVFGLLADQLRDVDARVIVTSRREVFEQFARESLAAAELVQFREEMSIVKPSYSPAALETILNRMATGRCAWHAIPECRELVHDAINAGKLSTPLVIRDLIAATIGVLDRHILAQRISNRQGAVTRVFAGELKACSPATKLVLSLVFLLEWCEQAELIRLFGTLWPALADVFGAERATSFMQEVRPQLGYRLEQHGSRNSHLRFAHPNYEEAFVASAESDVATASILRTVVASVGDQHYFSVQAAARQYARKYPSLSEEIFSILLTVVGTDEPLKRLGELTRQVVGAFGGADEERCNRLLAQIAADHDLAGLVNQATVETTLAAGFRSLFHLRERQISGFEAIEDRVDWERVYERLAAGSHFDQVLSAIDWAMKLAPDAATRVFSRLSFSSLQRRFETLESRDRERALRLLRDHGLVSAAGRLVHNLSRGATWHERLCAVMDNSGAAEDRMIIVDEGAARALASGTCSLLPAGVTSVHGEFEEGEAVAIHDQSGRCIAAGIVEYASEEIRAICGCRSSEIQARIGVFRGPSVVQTDYLLLTSRPRRWGREVFGMDRF